MTELAKNLADHVAAGMAAHHNDQLLNHREARHDEKKEFLEILEHEGVEAIQQILGQHLTDLPMTPEVRALLERVVKPEHQAEIGAIAGILIAIGYMLGGAALAGPTSSLSIGSMRVGGNYAISPEGVAAAAVRGRLDTDHALDLAKDSGVSPEKFTDMASMSVGTLSPDQWMQLWRWGRIGDDDIDRVLKLTGLDPESIVSMKRMRQGPPSAAFAAQARTQGQIDQDTYLNLLAWNGIDEQYASAIYETEGQTMPPDMANRLFREGRIDQAQYEQILIESNLKNKYVPLMALLRFRVPPMRQIVSAFHKGLIERPYAEEALGKLGFAPVDAKWMLDAAVVTASTATHHLTMQQSIALYEGQIWSRDEALASIVAIGWDNGTANAELDLADHRKTVARQSRSANAIGTRYVGWKIDRQAASNALDALNLPATARDEALEAWDIERAERMHIPSLAELKAMHKKGVVSNPEVRAMLIEHGYGEVWADKYIATYFA